MATLRVPLENKKSSMNKPIQIKIYQTAVGLDIDCLEGRVYWSDVSGRAIRSASFNGSNKIDFIKEGRTINSYWKNSNDNFHFFQELVPPKV